MQAKSTRFFSLGKFKNFLAKSFNITNSGSLFSRGLLGELKQPLNGVALSGMRLSVESLFTVWRNHGDVFACVRELQQNTGSQGYIWVNKNDSNKDPNPDEVKKAEAFLNYGQTFRSLKNKTIQYQQISGNAYLHVLRAKNSARSPLGLEFVDPRTLSVVTDQYGNIIKWMQMYNGESLVFEIDEICHFKQYEDPNSCVFGLSPMEPIIWETRTDLSAMIYNYAFFTNDAQPAAQYILDESTNPEEQQAIVEGIRSQLQGPENHNKSIVMAGVKEIKTLQFSQKDMEFMTLRKFTTEKICAAYGVPKSVLNYTDGVNYSNGENQSQKFWEGTITPLQDLFAEFLNKYVLPKAGINQIKIEFISKTFNDEQWAEASSRADQTQGVMTLNEVREKRGLAPMDPKQHGEYVDKPLLLNGAGVKPIEDVGIDIYPDGAPAILNNDQASKEIERIERMGKMGKRIIRSQK